MTIKELLNNEIKKLKENKIEKPILKAKIILAFILEENKEYLTINENETINKEYINEFKMNIERLINKEPLQYIVGNQEFMKLDFFVNENVLIPRQDTETLVEEVINLSKNIKEPKILDLCTGSGAIAISLFKNLKTKKIMATDISKKALKVFKINTLKNKIENEIEFLKSDLFNQIDKKNKFDIIVSNPPYIKTNVIKTLGEEVQKEPKIALNRRKRWIKNLQENYKKSR